MRAGRGVSTSRFRPFFIWSVIDESGGAARGEKGEFEEVEKKIRIERVERERTTEATKKRDRIEGSRIRPFSAPRSRELR